VVQKLFIPVNFRSIAKIVSRIRINLNLYANPYLAAYLSPVRIFFISQSVRYDCKKKYVVFLDIRSVFLDNCLFLRKIARF